MPFKSIKLVPSGSCARIMNVEYSSA